MITAISFCEEFSVEENEGFCYRYICVEGYNFIFNFDTYEEIGVNYYEETFNITCDIDCPGLSADPELENIHSVIGRWLCTDEAANSFTVSTLRIMFFNTIFVDRNSESEE